MSKSLSFFLLFLLVNSTLVAIEGRPLNIIKWGSHGGKGVVGGFFDGLTLGSIKESGPSPGQGNKYTDAHTLGGRKKSGQSPGEGHKYTNSHTLGGIKAGPSPGQGHKFTNAQTLGGIKESGPSPGEGHSSVTGTHH
ncbi:hypothetical protein FEM48_Zijuj08G0123900 [Ziziphus jujuba var. spinosa]|uniref:Uncharacterized protein n=1 Tax=Ziziphus jujuba var. spinosa TaxID=714518 RepID=A0A978UZ31_ZIZJJ|nr:hypothetical protein FEM48_Zijuj08G0123900 [Ziziphus jujuba var. spinosa]